MNKKVHSVATCQPFRPIINYVIFLINEPGKHQFEYIEVLHIYGFKRDGFNFCRF